ncbi:MAG TPA: Zn-dependent hydrolase [Gammaproteobacteria bacterium]|nr:Zn-dependent hydrolase [Gammaproteobacteria bacterium]HIL96410.1 Zn-dependent hydrolase [Pseudomonadales bacterium]
MENLSINSERLWQSIMEMAEIGATEKGGCARLALTDLDKQARDLLVQWCREAKCKIEVDEMGNIFSTRPGKVKNQPVMTGSHLDTQPTGGKFDGVYGVLSGLEVIRTLNDHQIETSHPIQLVVWTNEEGSRFQPAMVGSGVVAGAFELNDIYDCRDADGLRFVDELSRIDYKGNKPATIPNARAYIEVHIEQGPILEDANDLIGVVTHQQGIRWYTVTVTGKESHAGTTPMPIRQDALMAAAEIALKVKSIAEVNTPSGCGTVGMFDCYPGSPNTIPGKVVFSVDLRHPDNATLEEMEQQLINFTKTLSNQCDTRVDGYWKYPARAFDENCVEAVHKVVQNLGFPYQKMITGAGHDASYMAQVIPTSMIFIPCKDGISHNEVEHATMDHCAAGCQVLLHTLLEISQS